jgi:magnesium transporter
MDTPTSLKLAQKLLTSPVRNLRWHSKKQVGSAPGTLVYTGPEREAPVKLSLLEYDSESFEEGILEHPDFQEISRRTRTTWVNVDGLNEVALIQEMGEAFGLHPLTLEDLVHIGQRPKLEEYDGYLFVVLRMLTLDAEGTRVYTEQVGVILGDGWVLSFQQHAGDVWNPVRERLRKASGRIRKRGADYLAYALIDAVVDHYFQILETMAETVEELEVAVLEDPKPDVMHRIHSLRQEMLVVRRAVWPLRELTNSLARTETGLIHDDTQVFLRDVYDHTVQVIDTTETLREVVSGLMDLYMSSVSNRMNEIMKVLTIMASIFIPLTFLAGIYGMNFQVMPELGLPWAYPALLAVMLAIGVALFLFFKKRGWL